MAPKAKFSVWSNQKPVLKSGSKTDPRLATALPGIHVPACTACNGKLNLYLEMPGRSVLLRVLGQENSGAPIVLSIDEMAKVARWFMKVALLAGHPSATHDQPDVTSLLPSFGSTTNDWLTWMTDGSSIPDGFSVFASRWDQSHVNWQESPTMTIDLPHLLVDDVECPFTHHSISIADQYVTIVWHPHWPIEHRQVVEGRAIQLWPALNACDLSSLPLVSPNELVFRNSEEVIGVASEELASLRKDPLSVERSLKPYTPQNG